MNRYKMHEPVADRPKFGYFNIPTMRSAAMYLEDADLHEILRVAMFPKGDFVNQFSSTVSMNRYGILIRCSHGSAFKEGGIVMNTAFSFDELDGLNKDQLIALFKGRRE